MVLAKGAILDIFSLELLVNAYLLHSRLNPLIRIPFLLLEGFDVGVLGFDLGLVALISY